VSFLEKGEKMTEKKEEKGERAPPFEKTPEADDNNSSTNTDKKRYCSMCGTKVDSYYNFCGNCGFNFNNHQNQNHEQNYLTNHINQSSQYNVNNKASNDLQWKPIVIGGLIALGVSFLLVNLSVFFIYNLDIFTILGILFLLGFTSLFIGGFSAGIIAKSNGGTHGMYAGLVYSFINIPINIYFGMPVDIFSIFWAAMLAMLFAGIGGLIGYAVTKSRKLQPRIISHSYYG
jgi:hypothetical protein